MVCHFVKSTIKMTSVNDVNRMRKMKNLYEYLNILIQFQGKVLGKVISSQTSQ